MRSAWAWLLALGVVVLGLIAAPRVFHNYDVVDCFLPWARASQGVRPWDVYTPGAGADDCDYPPLVPYLLTLGEALRRRAGAPEVGALAIVLLKLPNLLAQVALVPLALVGLRGVMGPSRAALAAVLFALSPALLVNSALWGQFDALLTFFVLAALVALLNERPLLAGVALGLALSTKLLAVVPMPLLALWTWRRLGARRLLQAAGAGLAVVALAAAPHVIAGRGDMMLRAYTGAVNYYPLRTAEAYNTWYVLDRYDVRVRGISPPVARRDDRPALGPVTYHQLGLAAFSLYTLWLAVTLARRPSRFNLLWTLCLQLFAFFMLPTQVHQRYIVPAVALASLLAPLSLRGALLFAGLTLTATLNQALDLVRALPWRTLVEGALTTAQLPLATGTARDIGAGIGLVNLALFVWATWAFRRELGAAAPDEALGGSLRTP